MPERQLHAVLFVLIATLGCQSTASVGTSCVRAADCPAPLVCGAGRCRSACTETRDCAPGSECVPVEGGAACSLAQDRCTEDADCTAPLVCGSDGSCRAACLSDADCTSDGHCVLAGRLVCVASPPTTTPSCFGGSNGDLAAGLTGWCVETSAGLGADAVTAVAEGYDHHGARLAIPDNAPPGAWVRFYQETELDGRRNVVFDRVRADVAGGTTTLAIELLDEHGLVLGRVARATAGDGESECTETGRATSTCIVEPFFASLAMSPALASWTEYANVDLRRVASVRRVFELARTGPGTVEVVVDNVGVYALPCILGWWRTVPHRASFDLDQPTSPPTGWSLADAPVRAFTVAQCGQALTLDGSGYVDWMGTLPPAYTASFAWHGAVRHSPLDGVTFVRELGGDVSVSVSAGRVVMTACGARVSDTAALTPTDARFQEMQLSVDRSAGRACLARSGHLIGCTALGTCTAGPPMGLRFGEASGPIGDAMGLDEIRVDDGVVLPDGSSSASGACFVDMACHEPGSLELRDAGSGACVAPSACSSVWLCPEAASTLDATLCGATAETECVVDESCVFGLRPCDGSPCDELHVERCAQPLAASCP